MEVHGGKPVDDLRIGHPCVQLKKSTHSEWCQGRKPSRLSGFGELVKGMPWSPRSCRVRRFSTRGLCTVCSRRCLMVHRLRSHLMLVGNPVLDSCNISLLSRPWPWVEILKGSTPSCCFDLQAKEHLHELLLIQDAIACLVCCLPGAWEASGEIGV